MAQRRSTETRLRALFDAAQCALAEDPGAEVSLAAIARRLATSPRQLERAFAEVGRTTFRAEMTSARVRKGATLLSDPELTVAAVANAVGYRQAPHFANAFRAAYGMLPAEWRREVHGVGRPNPYERMRREIAEMRESAKRDGRTTLFGNSKMHE